MLTEILKIDLGLEHLALIGIVRYLAISAKLLCDYVNSFVYLVYRHRADLHITVCI